MHSFRYSVQRMDSPLSDSFFTARKVTPLLSPHARRNAFVRLQQR